MHIDSYERNWMIFSFILLAVFASAIAVAAFGMEIQVPAPEERVDPGTVATDPNSPWSNPGLREIAPGKYDAYILARAVPQWEYLPKEITVPVGSRVTFYVTSPDVQHGFKIQDTNANFMVLPGQVSKLTVTFDKPGAYNFICTEFCGAGHGVMYGAVIVTP
ncbi:MAG: cupredoxin domain-containing protein [Chloroflexi bacterium]|nr:cupredoxin domain-containing protein [Chloroflexota bacterium]